MSFVSFEEARDMFNATLYPLGNPILFLCAFVEENWFMFEMAQFSAAEKW